jgi:hypothetical protein
MMRAVFVSPHRCLANWAGLALLLVCNAKVYSATVIVSVTPSADAFVRAAAPTLNYGGAGAIAISGAAATNATGQTNGTFDSLIRFPASNVVAELDAAIGSHAWVITSARLHLIEMASPPHPMFNRGVGTLEVRWIAHDNWIEGTGVPAQPTTDGVRYQDLPSLLTPATDVSLGYFTNSGLDAALTFELVPATAFANDIRAGREVGLYLTAVSPQIGFTIESRTFALSNNWPTLEITAVAAPDGVLRSIVKSAPAQVTVSFDTASNWVTLLQASSDIAFGSPANLLIVQPQGISVRTNVPDSMSPPSKFYRLLFTQ